MAEQAVSQRSATRGEGDFARPPRAAGAIRLVDNRSATRRLQVLQAAVDASSRRAGSLAGVVQRVQRYLAPGSDQPEEVHDARVEGLIRVPCKFLRERGSPITEDGRVFMEPTDPRAVAYVDTLAPEEEKDITLSTDPGRRTLLPRMDQREFAEAINKKGLGAPAFRYQLWTGEGLTRGAPNLRDPAAHFRAGFHLAGKRARGIHVNLDPTPDTSAYVDQYAEGGSFEGMRPGSDRKVTADELYTLRETPALLEKSSFYVSGEKLSKKRAFSDPLAPDKRADLAARASPRALRELQTQHQQRFIELTQAAQKGDLGQARELAAEVQVAMLALGFTNVASIAADVAGVTEDSVVEGKAGRDGAKDASPEQLTRGSTKLERKVRKLWAEWGRALMAFEDLTPR